jgi:hypothetical protein
MWHNLIFLFQISFFFNIAFDALLELKEVVVGCFGCLSLEIVEECMCGVDDGLGLQVPMIMRLMRPF